MRREGRERVGERGGGGRGEDWREGQMMKRNVYLHTNPHSVYIGPLRTIWPVGGVSVCV